MLSKLYISHRGNTNGPNKDHENSITYINETIKLGYHVEIDVWKLEDSFYLGHDEPQYKIGLDFLINDKLLCHAKNIEALCKMLEYPEEIHCFFHNEDDVTLSSRNYLISYPRESVLLTYRSIAMIPERVPNWDLYYCGGICSDYIADYKRKFSILR